MEVSDKSSDALRSATGRDYAEWYRLLDEWGAPGRPFREIADWLAGQGMSDWWAQKVIVEYEQARGVRKPGGRPDGTFTGGASKTVSAPAATVFEAFVDQGVRRRWLPDLELSERTSASPRSARFEAADGSRVNVTFESRGEQKCQVAVEHARLPDADAAELAKTQWRERLSAVKSLLEG